MTEKTNNFHKIPKSIDNATKGFNELSDGFKNLANALRWVSDD